MKDKSYGRIQQTELNDEVARYAEEISMRGFTVISDCFTRDELISWREKIDRIYVRQEKEFGREALQAIRELDACRAPLLYDFAFIELAAHSKVLSIVQRFLGDWFILNLQNATIVRPGIAHHQSSWHRDLPYHNGISSQLLAVNALLAVDDFSAETGGTQVVPFTHTREILPSDSYMEGNRVTVSVPAGSFIVFDTMLFHRAGFNGSSATRRSVNHLYTVPMIKQQYDFPRALAAQEATLDPAIARLLGFSSQVPLDDKTWRLARTARLQGRA